MCEELELLGGKTAEVLPLLLPVLSFLVLCDTLCDARAGGLCVGDAFGLIAVHARNPLRAEKY